jgi:hypothetical protein
MQPVDLDPEEITWDEYLFLFIIVLCYLLLFYHMTTEEMVFLFWTPMLPTPLDDHTGAALFPWDGIIFNDE